MTESMKRQMHTVDFTTKLCCISIIFFSGEVQFKEHHCISYSSKKFKVLRTFGELIVRLAPGLGQFIRYFSLIY